MKLSHFILSICFTCTFFACITINERAKEEEKEITVQTSIDSTDQVEELKLEKTIQDTIVTKKTTEDKGLNLGFLRQDSINMTVKRHNETEDMEMVLFSQKDHFICYTADEKESLRLQIMFNENDIALLAKYKAGTYGLELAYLGEEFIKGGSYPTIHKYYAEVVKGKYNGIYKLTHSGNYDYAQYTGLNGKIFNFTINLENGRSKEACL